MNDPTGALIEAARKNNMEQLLECLKSGGDPTADDSLPLWWACKNGNGAMVDLLIPLSNPCAYENEALRIAFLNKHNNVCLALLPYCDVEVRTSNPLDIACFYQRSDLVALLLGKTDPQSQVRRMKDLDKPVEHINLLESVIQNMMLSNCVFSSPSVGAKRKI